MAFLVVKSLSVLGLCQCVNNCILCYFVGPAAYLVEGDWKEEMDSCFEGCSCITHDCLMMPLCDNC